MKTILETTNLMTQNLISAETIFETIKMKLYNLNDNNSVYKLNELYFNSSLNNDKDKIIIIFQWINETYGQLFLKNIVNTTLKEAKNSYIYMCA